jgi:phosphoglucomutase
VISAYYELIPDPSNPDQQVVFGTSGHRGSSLDTAFNDPHIAATTQAIVEYRAKQGITGPLFIGKDTHALSGPAWTTAIEVLIANGVTVCSENDDEYTQHRRFPAPSWCTTRRRTAPTPPTASWSPRPTTHP